jgi:hypothetical protein
MSYGPFNPMLALSTNPPQDGADKAKLEKNPALE